MVFQCPHSQGRISVFSRAVPWSVVAPPLVACRLRVWGEPGMANATPALRNKYVVLRNAESGTSTALVPLRPALPVRPLRCVYPFESPGGSA